MDEDSAAGTDADRAVDQRHARRLAELEEVASVGSWDWDVATDTVTWSDQMYRLFGVKPDAFAATYEAYLECLHPEDRALASQNVERALTHGEPYEADYRTLLPDGEVRWLHCRGRAAIDDDGNVVRLVGTSQDVTERKLLESDFAHRALHDALTGLPNRSLLLDRLEHAMQRIARTGHETVVLFVDLDGFKAINDSAGHDAGDHALREVAQALRASVRQHDTVARYGGDEFVVVAEDIRWPADGERLAARVLDATSRMVGFRGGELVIRASVGGTIASTGAGPGEVQRDADTAMYRAKARGGGTISWVNAQHD